MNTCISLLFSMKGERDVHELDGTEIIGEVGRLKPEEVM